MLGGLTDAEDSVLWFSDNKHQTSKFHCVVNALGQVTHIVIWREMLMYLGEFHRPEDWKTEALWIVTKGMRKGFKSRLRRLYFMAATYNIGKARNILIFEGKMEDV
ncbi:hypothetical protein LIER_18210 [Lithospermum erythrorhizon]|uniref:Uncharacterized protein n=1 Tax=Lithospermum erythrorhizon TaxID=34254 RepID=A0AAV3QGB3_LITER